jgi:hypothetical protein
MSKKISGLVVVLLLFMGCAPEEEKDDFWSEIVTNYDYHPFIFIFSDTQIPFCANYGQPQLEKILNGEIDGITSKNINGFMMYPSILDPQYSNIAEELKFLFDKNGNNTLSTWPAYVNNLNCFNIDSNSWYTSIKNSQKKVPSIKLGIKTSPSNEDIKIYVKGEYTASIAKHSLALYVYRKSELANQETYSGKEIFTSKNKIISSLTPTLGKELPANSSGQEFRSVFSLNTNGETLSNLGVVVVIYNSSGSAPTEIINSLRLEEF